MVCRASECNPRGHSPWEISFKAVVQTLAQFLPMLQTTVATDTWCETLLAAIAAHLVADRPDRSIAQKFHTRRQIQFDVAPDRHSFSKVTPQATSGQQQPFQTAKSPGKWGNDGRQS